MDIRTVFDAHRRVVDDAASQLIPLLDQASRVMAETLSSSGQVLACGNGGSATDSQHFVGELVGRYLANRRALAAVALTADTCALTAIANDFGYERVFSRQVEALGRPGDVLLAISTSGKSPNVLEAARVARERGLRVIALTGQGGGKLGPLADVLLAVPSIETPRIQEVHILCLHVMAERIESLIGSSP